MHRYLTEGKVALTQEEVMEDILNTLGVFDKNEKIDMCGGLHREHQPKVDGAERATNSYNFV